MMERLNKMDKTILLLCREDQKYADDDRALIARIWKREGFHEVFIQKGLYAALNHVSDAQYIKRQRRNLQNLGLITPSEKVVEKRFTQFKEERDERGSANIHAIKTVAERPDHLKGITAPAMNKANERVEIKGNIAYIREKWDKEKPETALFPPVQTSMLGDR